MLKLNRKQEKAISIAINVMETVLSNGQEDEELSFAIEELSILKNGSIEQKNKEKAQRKYWNDLMMKPKPDALDKE